jgi:hypothetical protein
MDPALILRPIARMHQKFQTHQVFVLLVKIMQVILR